MTKDAKGLGSQHIIRSADKCTVAVFECCLIDGDLTVLGNAPKEVLEQAWLAIYSDYLQLVNKGKNTTHIRHLGKVYALSAKLEMVKSLCNAALQTQAHLYLKCLQDWGYKIDKPSDIKKVVAKLKADEVELTTLIQNLPKDTGQPLTREYFTGLMTEFEAMMHFPLSKEALTMDKFCIYYCRLIDNIEAAKKQQKHG